MRKLMRHLSAPEVRVLVYLQTRCSQYFICYPTLDEIAHDLAMKGPRNVTPHIKALEKKKFIKTASGGGKRYYLVCDPRVPITHLVETGNISEQELFEINQVLRDLNQETIPAAIPKPGAPSLVAIRKAK
jgi:SOS-response transcriptional repressor LexA